MHCLLLVFALDSHASFDQLSYLYDSVVNRSIYNTDYPIILVGNKKDLDAQREVSSPFDLRAYRCCCLLRLMTTAAVPSPPVGTGCDDGDVAGVAPARGRGRGDVRQDR